VLKDLLPRRPDLRLILMSATLNAELFSSYFGGAPVIHIPESPEGQKMLSFRRSLPAYKENDKLLQAIARNQVLIVSSETSCGKTTQLPQYVLESKIESGHGAFCNIICTQPRRISAMAVAERVAIERERGMPVSVHRPDRYALLP